MALGTMRRQERFENPGELLGERLRGVYRLLAEYGGRLFPVDYFADLHKDSVRGPRMPAEGQALTGWMRRDPSRWQEVTLRG